jgi:hypothetical protein
MVLGAGESDFLIFEEFRLNPGSRSRTGPGACIIKWRAGGWTQLQGSGP